MKICVIGAGIVGCSAAYHLARLGHQVQLIDSAAQPGSGTSFANGAQLSYSYVEPFASPGTLRSIPSLLLSPDSPIRFRLKADPQQWLWIAAFLRACSARRVAAGTQELLALANVSRTVFGAWMSEEDWPVNFRQNGKLVLCPNAGVLRKQEAQVKLQAALGSHQQVLGRQECIEREPALQQARSAFVGGIWTADECVADPFLACQAMSRSLVRLGGEVSLDTEVISLVREGERVVAARTSTGDVRADAFVVAAGHQSRELVRPFGVRLPIYPLKGYSITVPFTAAAGDRPVASVTDLGRKTVYAPLGERLRVAAMVEINGYDLSIPQERVQAMIDSVQDTYPDLCDVATPEIWAGLRPATPDSLPVIGRVRNTNLFLNSGHGGLGLTLAAGSAVRLGDDIEKARSPHQAVGMS
jgi:D-amino-acid dehydrogenase